MERINGMKFCRCIAFLIVFFSAGLVHQDSVCTALDTRHDELIEKATECIAKDQGAHLKEVLNQGLSPNASRKGFSLLNMAVYMDRISCASALLSAGATVDATNPFGGRPLHSAESSEMAKILLEFGASTESRDMKSRTPLHKSAKIRSADVVRTLLEAGADIESKDEEGKTPLLDAIAFRNTEVVELLLKKGADVNVRDNHGWSAIHYAAQSGEVSLVRKLLTPENLNAPNDDGQTPLWLASYDGLKETVEFLLSQGADGSIKDDRGFTPLDAALAGKHSDPDVPRNREFDYAGVIRLLKAAQRRNIYPFLFLGIIVIGVLYAALRYSRRTRAAQHPRD